MIFLLWSRKYGITDWFVSPQFYVETLTCSVTIFGDEASNQEVKVKWGLNPVGLVSLREEPPGMPTLQLPKTKKGCP